MSASTSETTVPKNIPEMSIAQMRMESIRAGLLSAGAVGLAAVVAWPGMALLGFQAASSPIEWLVNLAVALSSGFFFGVSYRYIVRRDDNLHLGSGAVGAFAFVRSLAQIEATWTDTFTLLPWLLVTGESFLWFAAARYTLDWAIRQGWINPLD